MTEKLTVDEIRILKGCLEQFFILSVSGDLPDITLGKDDIELWEKLESIAPHQIPGRTHSARKLAENATSLEVQV